ncbi:SDR family oxidoreductase [Sinomonas sp. P47F7]|uniref:SDR family oxidoreductase n=1 Tax=Sinomonas sp. P47F7 TaxID=3410987 RepID=UPI003BF60EFC
MSLAGRLARRRILVTGEDPELSERLGAVFERCGAVLDIEPADSADGTRIARSAARHLGGLDVLVNTGPAVIPEVGERPAAVRRGVERALEHSMALLVTTTEAALPSMNAGASIINTAGFSAHSLVLSRGQEALATAVLETTRGWAQALGPRGVRVNAVVGGPRWDPILEAKLDHGQRPEPVTDEEELDAFVYLASAESSHVSGSVIAVARALTSDELEPSTDR